MALNFELSGVEEKMQNIFVCTKSVAEIYFFIKKSVTLASSLRARGGRNICMMKADLTARRVAVCCLAMSCLDHSHCVLKIYWDEWIKEGLAYTSHPEAENSLNNSREDHHINRYALVV